ncbi:unnamed protein product [Hapterophycus canaliculatus]
MVFAKRRRGALVGLLIAGLAFASGKPAWGSTGEGLKNAKSGGQGTRPGNEDLGGDILDFSSVSPKDCANYLCVSSSEKATNYIESGCPGQFALYEPDSDYEQPMQSLMGMEMSASDSYSTGGVSTQTLLSLACASGVFAVGVGFAAGYKASPSFAYMRIPSLS